MKKKILLMLAIMAMLICVFAVSAQAATIYKAEDGTQLFSYVDENNDYVFDSYNGAFAKTDSDGNELTWYIKSTTTENGNTIHTVACLKTLGEAGQLNGSGAYSFTSPVTNKNTVSVNYPDNKGIKTIPTFGSYGSRSQNNILFCYLPNTLTAFPESLFQETPVIVGEIDDETPVTFIPHKLCHEARNIKVVNIPASVTVIESKDDRNGATFCNTLSLKTVTFAKNSNLTRIHKFAFYNSGIEEISFPDSLIAVNQNLFRGCKNLKVIRFGANFQYFENVDEKGNIATGHQSLTHTATALREIYIPASFYSSKPSVNYRVSYAFDCSSAQFFFTGTKDQLDTAIENFKNSEWTTGATEYNYIISAYNENKIVTWAEYSSNKDSYTGRYIITDYNVCDAFYESVHEEDNNPCVINCERCSTLGVMEENPEHVFVTSIAYENGYASLGVITKKCTSAGCECNANPETSDAQPIFTGFLYSTKIDQSHECAMVLSYDINVEAIEIYNSIAENALSYGVIAVASERLGASEPLQNGVAQDGVISTEISNKGISKLDFIIRGSAQQWNEPLKSDETKTAKDIEFYMIGFVKDGEGIKYFYDKTFSTTVSDLKTISFNKI